MVEENARDVPGSLDRQDRNGSANSSYRAGEASVRSPEERDRSRNHSAHRGGLRLSTGTRPYSACRSIPCCLAVWSIWVESSTALGGFRVLKKTLEAPYTTKVNYRDPTSRGTTHCPSAVWGGPFSPPGDEDPPPCPSN